MTRTIAFLSSSRPAKNPFVRRRLSGDDEFLILRNQFFTLDSVGSALWSLIDGEIQAVALVAETKQLMSREGAEPQVSDATIFAYLLQLDALGLIVLE